MNRSPITDKDFIAQTILDMTAARGPHKSICPSEVARRLAPEDWERLMEAVRHVAYELCIQRRIRVTQKGKDVDLATVRGPIRLSQQDSPINGDA